jgi:hypothetical protein
MFNVILRRVRVTCAAVEKQNIKYMECVCNLINPVRKAHRHILLSSVASLDVP